VDDKYSGGEPLPAGGIESKIEITRQELSEHNFEALEHITIKVWIAHKVRGDVEVEITSPNSIRSILGSTRSADLNSNGYPGWTFMSVKHWLGFIFELIPLY
jgi:kexin